MEMLLFPDKSSSKVSTSTGLLLRVGNKPGDQLFVIAMCTFGTALRLIQPIDLLSTEPFFNRHNK